jgi:DNA-binding transcriptional regulator LsrR (DeoR family)
MVKAVGSVRPCRTTPSHRNRRFARTNRRKERSKATRRLKKVERRKPDIKTTKSQSGLHRGVCRRRDIVELVLEYSYFHQGKPSFRSAHDVADDLQALGYDITVAGVLACRIKAFKDGLLTVLLNRRHELSEVTRLEAMLQERFGIKALLVAGEYEMLDPLPRERLQNIHASVNFKLADRAAAYLTQVLAAAAAAGRTDYGVGIASGQTMRLLAQRIMSTEPGPRPRGLKFDAIVGIPHASQCLPAQSNVIASSLGSFFKAASGQVPCPAIVSKEDYEATVKHPQVRAALDEIANVDLVFTSMGPIQNAGNARDITFSTDPKENALLFASARAAGAECEICGWAIGSDGRAVDTPYRSVGLGLERLAWIARDEDQTGRQVVLIAGGDRRRLAGLRAALAGGYVSVLLTDTVSARVLLGEIEL